MSGVDNVARAGRALEKAKWELPERFRWTPEMLAKSVAEQNRLSALVATPFGQPSVQDVWRARAVVVAEHLQATLLQVKKQISSAILSGADTDLPKMQEDRHALAHRLAENYALFGRYDLAVEVEPDPVYREHYQQILEAVWRDDGVDCDCDDHRGSGEHADITSPKHVIEEEVWSVKMGALGFLRKCSRCGLRNVVPTIPEPLRRQRAHRARAAQLVSGMSIKDAEATLRQHGHVTAKLLK